MAELGLWRIASNRESVSLLPMKQLRSLGEEIVEESLGLSQTLGAEDEKSEAGCCHGALWFYCSPRPCCSLSLALMAF